MQPILETHSGADICKMIGRKPLRNCLQALNKKNLINHFGDHINEENSRNVIRR